MDKSEQEQEAIARIIEWRDRGVGPGGIASALQAEGLPSPEGGPWRASTVRGILERIDAKAGIVRAAEAVFTPGEDEDYGGEGWAGHCGDKFTRPWLDRTTRDVRDKGCTGEQGGDGAEGQSATFADRALAAVERAEES